MTVSIRGASLSLPDTNLDQGPQALRSSSPNSKGQKANCVTVSCPCPSLYSHPVLRGPLRDPRRQTPRQEDMGWGHEGAVCPGAAGRNPHTGQLQATEICSLPGWRPWSPGVPSRGCSVTRVCHPCSPHPTQLVEMLRCGQVPYGTLTAQIRSGSIGAQSVSLLVEATWEETVSSQSPGLCFQSHEGQRRAML